MSEEGVTDGASTRTGQGTEQNDGQGQAGSSSGTGSGNESGSEGRAEQGNAAAAGSESSGDGQDQGQSKDQGDVAASQASEDLSLGEQIQDSTGDAPEKPTQETDGSELTEYAAFELDEGLVLSDDLKGEFSELMLGSNMGQESAQGVMKLIEKVQEGFAAHIEKAEAEQRKTWLEEAKKDPVLAGKDGKQLETNMKIAYRGLDKYAELGESQAAEVKDVYDTGLLDRPLIFRLFLGMGHATMPDAIDPTGDPAISGTEKKEPWDVMYPYMSEGHDNPQEQ